MRMSTDFRGRERLIQSLDAAMDAGDTHAVMRAMRNSLCNAIRDDGIELPACVFTPCPEHYARRELYRSPERGYTVMAMTWNPHQGTPIHDHSGMWCVEGVWRGELEVVQYELDRHDGERYHFREAGTIQAGRGSAGSLIPPFEHHTIVNPSDDAITVSVHVYQQRMTRCSVFEPAAAKDGWYLRSVHELAEDAIA